jgi:hypothetical protein
MRIGGRTSQTKTTLINQFFGSAITALSFVGSHFPSSGLLVGISSSAPTFTSGACLGSIGGSPKAIAASAVNTGTGTCTAATGWRAMHGSPTNAGWRDGEAEPVVVCEIKGDVTSLESGTKKRCPKCDQVRNERGSWKPSLGATYNWPVTLAAIRQELRLTTSNSDEQSARQTL